MTAIPPVAPVDPRQHVDIKRNELAAADPASAHAVCFLASHDRDKRDKAAGKVYDFAEKGSLNEAVSGAYRGQSRTLASWGGDLPTMSDFKHACEIELGLISLMLGERLQTAMARTQDEIDRTATHAPLESLYARQAASYCEHAAERLRRLADACDGMDTCTLLDARGESERKRRLDDLKQRTRQAQQAQQAKEEGEKPQ